MDMVYRAGPVLVFLSRPYPQFVPADPSVVVNANFSDLVELGGYDIDFKAIAPDGTVSLRLYWRPIGDPTRSLKVFVHLRNAQGETIAQADHFIYEGFLTPDEWNKLQEEGEWLRDTADLRLPLPLPTGGGPYRIYVGLYDPDTLERVPMLDDASGENAFVIDLPVLL
jgi:hypothetical protein